MCGCGVLGGWDWRRVEVRTSWRDIVDGDWIELKRFLGLCCDDNFREYVMPWKRVFDGSE